MSGIVVNFDLKAVGTCRRCGIGNGRDKAGIARCMAGIGNDGKVRELAQNGNGGNIEDVAGALVVGANAALAQHHALVAVRHDVLSRHEQFVDRSRQAAFEQDGLVGFPKLFQEREILHITSAHLEDVDILEQRKVARIHDLRDDRYAEFTLHLGKNVKAILAHSLEGIGRRAGLEGSAAKDRRPRLLRRLGDNHALLFAFDRTRPRHDLEATAAECNAADFDDGIVGVKLAIRLLERLGNPANRLNLVHGFEQVDIDGSRIADQADNRLLFAHDYVRLDVLAFKVFAEFIEAVLGDSFANNGNHGDTFL